MTLSFTKKMLLVGLTAVILTCLSIMYKIKKDQNDQNVQNNQNQNSLQDSQDSKNKLSDIKTIGGEGVKSKPTQKPIEGFFELQNIVEKITGVRPKVCFPNQRGITNSLKHNAQFYKNINYIITDAVSKCIKDKNYTDLAKIYLLIPKLFDIENKDWYHFVMYDSSKNRTDDINNVSYVQIIDQNKNILSLNNIRENINNINKGILNLDPYTVSAGIGPDLKVAYQAVNPTVPPSVNNTPVPCKRSNGLNVCPTSEYFNFYTMTQELKNELNSDTKYSDNNDKFVPLVIFGKLASYLYVKGNAYVGVIKILPGKNDNSSVGQTACCEDENCSL